MAACRRRKAEGPVWSPGEPRVEEVAVEEEEALSGTERFCQTL